MNYEFSFLIVSRNLDRENIQIHTEKDKHPSFPHSWYNVNW